MTRAYLALGSNLGDRLAHLQTAVDDIAGATGVRVDVLSRVYETSPVGGPPQDPYLNAETVKLLDRVQDQWDEIVPHWIERKTHADHVSFPTAGAARRAVSSKGIPTLV